LNPLIDAYVRKQGLPQREICQRLRELILKTAPDVKEEMKWGVPTYGDGKCYFVALKDHVNLGFSLKDLPKEQQVLLQGSGKTMKHIALSSVEQIDEEKIVKLLAFLFKP
jgi:hypothetical protein